MSKALDLAAVNVTSGVNEDGEGFCTISAESPDGRLMLGQLSPDEVRGMAMAWLRGR